MKTTFNFIKVRNLLNNVSSPNKINKKMKKVVQIKQY